MNLSAGLGLRRFASFKSIRSSGNSNIVNDYSRSQKGLSSSIGGFEVNDKAQVIKSIRLKRQAYIDPNELDRHRQYERHKEANISQFTQVGFAVFISLFFGDYLATFQYKNYNTIDMFIYTLVCITLVLLWSSCLTMRFYFKRLRRTSIEISTLRIRSIITRLNNYFHSAQIISCTLTLGFMIISNSNHQFKDDSHFSSSILPTCILTIIPLVYQIIINNSYKSIIIILWSISSTSTFISIFFSNTYSFISFFLLIFHVFIGMLCYELSRQSEATFHFVVDELHLLEEILLNKFKEEEDKNRASELRRMIGTIAHDVKSPLSSLRLGLDSLRSLLVKKEYTSGINCSLLEEIDICRDLETTFAFMSMTISRAMDFQRTNKGFSLVPDLEYGYMEPIINRVIECCQHTKSNVVVKVDPLPRALLTLKLLTDGSWMFDNLLCLVSNAVKYTEDGCVRVRFHIVQQRGLELDMLRVEVEDAGPGFTNEAKQAVFSLFNDDQRKVGGAGLGLYCLSRRVKALGGLCGVLDRDEGGAIFWFEVPFTTYKKKAHQAGSPLSVSVSGKSIVGSFFSSGKSSPKKSRKYGFPASNVKHMSVIESEKKVSSKKSSKFGSKILSPKLSRRVISLKAASRTPSLKQIISNLSGKLSNGMFSVSSARPDNSHLNEIDSSVKDGDSSIYIEDNGTLRLLVLGEDNDIICSLKSAGHHIDWAESGIEAYEILLRSTFDCVLVSPCISIDEIHLFIQKFRFVETSIVRLIPRQMISVVSSVSEKQLLDLISIGADYILNTPFSIREFDVALHSFASRDDCHNLDNPVHLHNDVTHVNEMDAPSSILNSNRNSFYRKHLHSMSVLIVDDSITILKTLGANLKNSQFDVTKAENGLIALDLLSARHFDAVLLDQQMPVMDGPECVRALRKLETSRMNSDSKFHQLVIGMSANTDDECKLIAYESGVDYFVQKPFTVERFQNILKQYYGLDSYGSDHDDVCLLSERP